MAKYRIVSISDPVGSDAEASTAVARLIGRADVLGLWPELEGDQVVDRTFLVVLFTKLSEVGLARDYGVWLAHATDVSEYRELFDHALEVTEYSPVPKSEWGPMQATLGDELLVDLLDISPMSLRRYSRGDRGTPDLIAQRLHFLALVVADLSGSYNDYGIRRWFARPRHALDEKSPSALLSGGFDPSSAPAQAVRQLAADLVGAGAA